MIVEMILSIFLERTPRKINANSSTPSIQTKKDQSALIASTSRAKGKKLVKGQAPNIRTVETVPVAEVVSCDRCGEPLTETPCTQYIKTHQTHPASKDNLKEAKAKGVKDMAFHKKKGLKVEEMAKSDWVYRKLRNFRAGIEAGISYLKRCFGLRRCNWKGSDLLISVQ